MNQWILNQRYQLQKRLSKKGARHTFIAQDLHTHQPVVVKVLLLGPDFQWQDHKLFERGAAALKSLSFPGLPQYLDYFDVNIGQHQGFAQVQTYIPAKSLQAHLQAGRTFSEEDIRQLALQLLDILQYLHQRQPAIIHRDIKPSNILLEDRTGNHVGQAYLVDFDSVKTGATRSDYTMTIVGTYGYMPPEQFSGQAKPASDLYSLGATLIYAATGKHPADLPQKDMRIAFESQVSLNQNLVGWLKWMTHPTLDHRLSSTSRAIQALKHPNQWIIPNAPSQLSTFSPATRPIRPTGSKIKVIQKKQSKIVEILLPPLGLKGVDLLVICFAGLPSGLVTFFLAMGALSAFSQGQFLASIAFLLVSLPVVAIAAFVLFYVLDNLFNAVKFRIEPNVIIETHTFGKSRDHSALRIRLVSDKTLSFVRLKTAGRHFDLPTETQAEREWLIYTLSQRLQLPIEYL